MSPALFCNKKETNMSKDIEAGCGRVRGADAEEATFRSPPWRGSWEDVGEKRTPAPKKGTIARTERVELAPSETPRLIYVARDNVAAKRDATKLIRLSGSDDVLICERVEIDGPSTFLTLSDVSARVYGAHFVVSTTARLTCHGVETVNDKTTQSAPLLLDESCSGEKRRTGI